jgi:hypothetical protein
MMTHAEVHAAIARMLMGSRLQSFMVSTHSFQDESGAVAVEWGAVISSGREPVIYARAREPAKLVDDVRRSVESRRPFYDIPSPPALARVDTRPPEDTALGEPASPMAPRPGERPYSPTEGSGEFR